MDGSETVEIGELVRIGGEEELDSLVREPRRKREERTRLRCSILGVGS